MQLHEVKIKDLHVPGFQLGKKFLVSPSLSGFITAAENLQNIHVKDSFQKLSDF